MGDGLVGDLALAGLGVGSAAALGGVGLVAGYRATGVLNLAQGAQAMVVAFLLRELVVVRHWPLPLAAACCLLLAAPGLGLLLDLLVFRPLHRRGAGPAEAAVAGVGVFVLLIGLAVVVWGATPYTDAPRLVPATPLALPGGRALRLDTAVQLALVVLLALGTAAVTRWTPFGTTLRAVVDDRRLAELSGLPADRVASVGWAFGSFTAGLVGVVLAPNLLLDPYGLPLLVLETVAVAVAARLRSLPVAVAGGLVIGVAQSELTLLRPPGALLTLTQAVQANLFVVALLAATLLLGGRGRPVPPLPGGGRGAPGGRVLAAAVLVAPLALGEEQLRWAVQLPALALVLLSVTVVTGRGGQLSLGQAGYAGLGALGTALLTTGRLPGLPPLAPGWALLLAVLAALPFGLLTGWPAIRRSGLALALVTFAVATALSRFVFQQPYATAGLVLARPSWLEPDRAFYAAELVLLGAGLLVADLFRRGRLGRAVAALRDDQGAAAAAGVRVARLKLLAFTAGAGLAALGGGLLGMAGRAFDGAEFDPVRGLVWSAAVLVAGADSAVAAVLAAGALVALDAALGPGASALVVGVLAAGLGRLPGGLAAVLPRAVARWG
ncbi:ABC transporter permease [Kitasatospora sp. NPDC051853]|uniref:ABC transporter permease subunit n=1 Tax=Kitasatospora sp. NPDC051853 TaxID=3364058 RepID=UPI00378F7599